MFNKTTDNPIVLDNLPQLKKEKAYKYTDNQTGKELVIKVISKADDQDFEELLVEFKKMVNLGNEPAQKLLL